MSKDYQVGFLQSTGNFIHLYYILVYHCLLVYCCHAATLLLSPGFLAAQVSLIILPRMVSGCWCRRVAILSVGHGGSQPGAA